MVNLITASIPHVSLWVNDVRKVCMVFNMQYIQKHQLCHQNGPQKKIPSGHSLISLNLVLSH